MYEKSPKIKHPKNASCTDNYVKINVNKKGIKVCHLNIQSLTSCFDEFKLWFKKNSFHVITLSETWLDGTIHDSEIDIPGYVFERKDRNRNGGGVAVYIKDDIQYSRRNDIENDNTESLWIEIQQVHKKSFVIGTLYRPETGVEYFDFLSEMMDSVSNENKEIFLLGDLNCDFLKKNHVTNHMSVFMNLFNLTQLVDKPTRITPTSRTLLDVILTTNANICTDTRAVHKSFSDHSLVQTTIMSKCKVNNKCNNSNNHVTKKFRCFKNFKVDDFVNDLKESNWTVDDTQLTSVAWNSFVSKFTMICDKHAPIKIIKFKDKMCPWLENRNDIFHKMHDRDYHHNKAIQGNVGNEHWNKYKMLRNQVNVLMREAKRDYFTNEINESAGDSKKMWSTLKKLLPNKKGSVSSTLPPTTKGESILVNDNNHHFTNIGTTCNTLKGTNSIRHGSSINAKFKFTEITVEQVLEELTSISSQKVSGLDNICVKLLKLGKDAVAPILCKIFNLSLKQGCFPDDLKVARVIPIYKVGKQEEFSNYRPISIVPVCSKVLEKIVHKQLYKYITDNNIMYDGQSGFRKNHSTCTALTKTIDKWNNEIDVGNYVGAVFVDLSKAFDMVNHELLIQKLYSLGIKENEILWFKSYLTQRTQCVSVNNSMSTPNVISSGVPQGSILGPLLFLLFINDMPNDLKHSTVDIYADDTLIYVYHKDVNVIEKKLNEDLHNLSIWLVNNHMKVNVNKTKVMLLGTTAKTSKVSHVHVFMDDIEVGNVTCYKYLGVHIDVNLKWKEQINIIRKVCAGIAVIYSQKLTYYYLQLNGITTL